MDHLLALFLRSKMAIPILFYSGHTVSGAEQLMVSIHATKMKVLKITFGKRRVLRRRLLRTSNRSSLTELPMKMGQSSATIQAKSYCVM